jgi:hypothetical protein
MAPLLPRASKGESTRQPMRMATYERFVDLCDECSERPLSAPLPNGDNRRLIPLIIPTIAKCLEYTVENLGFFTF